MAQIFANRPKMLPTSASILVTENCNLGCTYCFEIHNDKSMTIETVRKTLEFLCKNAVDSGVGRFDAMIFGGEPLLNPDVVEEILSYGYELSQKNNVQFTSNMITNCTIMNDRIKKMLIKWRDLSNLTIQLSIDGKQEVQDMYRITKTGKGSFKLVEKNVPIFKEIFADDPRRLSVHGCVNRNSLPHLYESFQFFKEEWGFQNIWFLPVIEEKWRLDDVVEYDKQNALIYESVLKTVKETGDISSVYEYAPMDRCMDKQVRPGAPCGAGKNFVTVTCTGEIYPCHQIYFHDPEKETLIGNVYTGLDEPARTMYVDYTQENLSCPSTCENVHCFRCLAVNWIENGNVFSQVRGYYCYLSSTDKKYQDMLRKEVEAMGLMESNLQSNFKSRGEFAVDMEDYVQPSRKDVQEECCGGGADEMCGCGSEKAPMDDLDKALAESTCLCNARESASVRDGCDIVANRANAMPGNNPDNPDCLCDARSSSRPYNFKSANKAMEDRFGERIDNPDLPEFLTEKKGIADAVTEAKEAIKEVAAATNSADDYPAKPIPAEPTEVGEFGEGTKAGFDENKWAQYIAEGKKEAFGEDKEIDEDELSKYNDGQYRFITGEAVDNKLLIEVRIDKRSKIHMKYENTLDKTISTEVEKYEGELPIGYYEVLEYDTNAQYFPEEEVEQEEVHVGDGFEDVVSFALQTILQKLIGIEERLDSLEKR